MADKSQVPDRDGRYARNQQLEKSVQRGQTQRRAELANVPIRKPEDRHVPRKGR